jgi:hypothetical protein
LRERDGLKTHLLQVHNTTKVGVFLALDRLQVLVASWTSYVGQLRALVVLQLLDRLELLVACQALILRDPRLGPLPKIKITKSDEFRQTKRRGSHTDLVVCGPQIVHGAVFVELELGIVAPFGTTDGALDVLDRGDAMEHNPLPAGRLLDLEEKTAGADIMAVRAGPLQHHHR